MRLINAAKSSGTDHLSPCVNSTYIEYLVWKYEALLAHSMSLIDRGANGGVAGDDVRIIFRTN
jgi:hypothetical protein